MPESFYDMVVVICFTVVPVVLLLLQLLLSSRKKFIWGFIVPVFWAAMGSWILIKGYLDDKQLSYEMLIVVLVGEAVLIGLLALCRYLKKRKASRKTVNISKK